MGLRRFIARRTLEMLFTIFVAMCINFFLFRIVPGNPYQILLDPKMSPEARLQMIERLGLDRPLLEQFGVYLINFITGFWGRSIRQQRPVVNILSERIPNTLLLMVPTFFLTVSVSLLLGVLAARRRGKKVDVSLLGICLLLSSMPVFWLGGTLLAVFGVIFNIFPVAGILTPGASYPNALVYISDVLRHLALPSMTLFLVSLGGYFLLVRNSVLDVFTEPYILTAEAKGLDPKTILFKHALRNAMLPVVTVIAMNFGFLIAGTVLTETVFSWPGMGLMMYEAIMARDYPVLETSFLLLTLFVVLANFVADIIYGYLDPRVKY